MPTENPKSQLYLEFCSSSQVRDFEQRHYPRKMTNSKRATENSKPLGAARGHHGQQVHFLIWYRSENVGTISGGSAVYACAPRDMFFGLNRDNRKHTLNGIIDNTTFRLECHERNLATRVLSLWRHTIVGYWKYLYDVEPYGFETFVENATLDDGRQRLGKLYLADNWRFLGETAGSTKNHIGVGLTGGRDGGKGSYEREKVPPKMVFGLWIAGFTVPQYCEYQSSWKAATAEGTPAEKALAKERTLRRARCMGTSNISGGHQ